MKKKDPRREPPSDTVPIPEEALTRARAKSREVSGSFTKAEIETSVPCPRCNGRGRALVKKEDGPRSYTFVREKDPCWLCVQGATTVTKIRRWAKKGKPFDKPSEWVD